jgi:hypothetical protein
MIDLDTATEQEIRRWLVENGESDFEWNKHIHPKSQELRDGGFAEQADILDDYFAKQHKATGLPVVLSFEQVKEKARKLKERMDAK